MHVPSNSQLGEAGRKRVVGREEERGRDPRVQLENAVEVLACRGTIVASVVEAVNEHVPRTE